MESPRHGNFLHRIGAPGEEHEWMTRLERAYLRRLSDPSLEDCVFGMDGDPYAWAIRMGMRALLTPASELREEFDVFLRDIPADRLGPPTNSENLALSPLQERLADYLCAVKLREDFEKMRKSHPLYLNVGSFRLKLPDSIAGAVSFERELYRRIQKWSFDLHQTASFVFAVNPETMEYLPGTEDSTTWKLQAELARRVL